MKKTISKQEANEKIENFFLNITNKTPKEIKKIKRFAMSYNILLKNKRKLFCKKCLIPYKAPKIRIQNKVKSVVCDNCENIARWRL
jgi:RNase P subunit RPR2